MTPTTSCKAVNSPSLPVNSIDSAPTVRSSGPLLRAGPMSSLRPGRRLARLRHRKELGRLHHSEPNWRRDAHTTRDHHARTRDRTKPKLDVPHLYPLLHPPTPPNAPPNPRTTYRADHR